MKKISLERKIVVFVMVAVLFLALICASLIYLLDFYRADDASIAEFIPLSEIIEGELDDGVLVFEPKNAIAGMIFYPGGKVEYTSYIPLMRALASKGILCILVKMPFNLAVFDINAADGLCESYPEIESWYIGGHSLGGAMAASYLDKNTDEFDGIVFLGAYSTADLSDEKIKALSVYGSMDGVMNMEKYEENRGKLPKNFEEHIIDGGCHSYFGMYGAQDGDGTPTVTNEEQILLTAELVFAFVFE